MKEVPNIDLPEVSGGDHDPNGCVPLPIPGPYPETDFPRNPFSPVYDAPTGTE